MEVSLYSLPQKLLSEFVGTFTLIFVGAGSICCLLYTSVGQIGIAGNSTRTVDFIMDRRPKKVALNAYKDILER